MPAVVFEAVEGALDEVAFGVECAVERLGCLGGIAERDDGARSALGQGRSQPLGVIGFVGDDRGRRRRVFEQQRIDPGHVVFVAAGQDEAPDAAEFVDDGMELGGAAAARPADRLGMRPGRGARAPSYEACCVNRDLRQRRGCWTKLGIGLALVELRYKSAPPHIRSARARSRTHIPHSRA